VTSNVGYHGEDGYMKIPLDDRAVGMGDKTIRTALCLGAYVTPAAAAQDWSRWPDANDDAHLLVRRR
jgi:hypothetical protein